jgi:hypothetical protein
LSQIGGRLDTTGAKAGGHRNGFQVGPLSAMAAIVDIQEKPIERICEICEMMGAADKFYRALPEVGEGHTV